MLSYFFYWRTFLSSLSGDNRYLANLRIEISSLCDIFISLIISSVIVGLSNSCRRPLLASQCEGEIYSSDLFQNVASNMR